MDAPFPVSVTEFPKQIAGEEEVAETVGNALTVIEITSVAVQPFTSVPVTVYEVVEAGVTVCVAPERFPGIHE